MPKKARGRASSGPARLLRHCFDVVAVGVADEGGVGPILRPMSGLVAGCSTGLDRRREERVDRSSIRRFEGQVQPTSHVSACPRRLQRQARRVLLGDPVFGNGLGSVASLNIQRGERICKLAQMAALGRVDERADPPSSGSGDYAEQIAIRVSQDNEVGIVGVIPIDFLSAQGDQTLDLDLLIGLIVSPEVEVRSIFIIEV